MPLRHYAIYAYLLNVYFSDRTLPVIKYHILWHQKTCSRHIKCANSVPLNSELDIPNNPFIIPNHQFRVFGNPSGLSVVKHNCQF